MELYERSLDMRERTLGIWHPDVQASLGNLAALMRGRCVGVVLGIPKTAVCFVRGWWKGIIYQLFRCVRCSCA
jgi:hypothetical protein